LSGIFDWSEQLAKSTAGGEGRDEHALAEVVRQFAAVFKIVGQTRSRLNSFAHALERTEIRWLPTWQHGDLTAGNVLFDGMQPRMLDWELSDARREPWFDKAYAWLALAILHHHREAEGSVADVLPMLWSRNSWVSNLGMEVFGERWEHSLPISWALVLVAMAAALRGERTQRTGADRWVSLVKGLMEDERTREVAPHWVPDW
jgi:aminoglycoside phosphotransferase (APT) family kinase protein